MSALQQAALPPRMASNADIPAGLTAPEAAERLKSEGGNVVPDTGGRSWWDIVRRNLFTFINITLILIGVVLILMGKPRDALLASGLAVVNGLVGVFQEGRAKRRLEQIALLNRTQASVVRDGANPDRSITYRARRRATHSAG